MNKITIKKIPFKLNGETIKEQEVLEFKAKDKDNKDFFIKGITGMKVISLFPDINTTICDAQTQAIARMATEHKNITFISISTDTVEVQSKWCAAHNIENILIVSDKEYKDFANKTNTLITKINKLARGFILLDDKNVIKGISLKSEIAAEPDYELLKTWIQG